MIEKPAYGRKYGTRTAGVNETGIRTGTAGDNVVFAAIGGGVARRLSSSDFSGLFGRSVCSLSDPP